MNMNVLVDGVTPRVVSLDEALRQWLDHRRTVLQRRSRHRLAAIVRRIEQLEGMVIVFLNLDEVIRIIREEDDAKGELKKAFKLTDLQVDYILDTRLRALRKLEEMELRKELDELSARAHGHRGAARRRRQAMEDDRLRRCASSRKPMVRRRRSASGARRFEDAPEAIDLDLAEAMIEREPVTVVVSQKGWIRALKGHVQDLSTLQFKGDDELDASFFAQTTSKDSRARLERQGLYARRLETARRTRPWRADPAVCRYRRRRRCRRRSAAYRGGVAAARHR